MRRSFERFLPNRQGALSLIGLLFLATFACSPDQGPHGREARDLQTNIALLLYMDSGHCLHSRKQAPDLGVLRCVPAPRTVCRDDALQDSGGNLVVTKPTADRARAELGMLISEAPACSDEIALTLVLPTFRLTAEERVVAIRTNNYVVVREPCANFETPQSAKLAERSAYAFLTSPLGSVARRAKVTGDETCLQQLHLTVHERAQVDAAHSGTVLVETSCFYGAASLGPTYFAARCNQAERDAAFSFDFGSK